MDKIHISGISCLCRIGVPESERKTRQRILVDVRLEADLRRAGRRDDLSSTVNYQTLEDRLRRIAEEGRFKLLERLAEVLALKALSFHRRVRAVTITVHKHPAPMPGTREVAVEITRRRRKS